MAVTSGVSTTPALDQKLQVREGLLKSRKLVGRVQLPEWRGQAEWPYFSVVVPDNHAVYKLGVTARKI